MTYFVEHIMVFKTGTHSFPCRLRQASNTMEAALKVGEQWIRLVGTCEHITAHLLRIRNNASEVVAEVLR